MKQTLHLKPTMTQKLNLSLSMKNALDVLAMNQSDLLDMINDMVNHNPVIEYTPSLDMNQYIQESVSVKRTLQDDLYIQLHTSVQPYDARIANYIIESLNHQGFLSYTPAQYIKSLGCSLVRFQKTLRLIQSFEPLGVAALNSVDSICIQLIHAGHKGAYTLLQEHAQALINKDYAYIAKAMNKSIHTIQEYLDQIRQCTPYPCTQYDTSNPSFIIPDFELHISEGDIELIPRQIGHIKIDDELALHEDECSVLRTYFEEAYYFIDALTKRNKTLLIMANQLIHIQKNHFLFQDELQPCTLLHIAEKTGFHESTVSRTLSNKYYMFEQEVYPVKDLFVSSTKEGSSKDSILKRIKKLIEEEDKSCPLADYELVEALKDAELYVSRRAISKYRAILHIPNSKERKK